MIILDHKVIDMKIEKSVRIKEVGTITTIRILEEGTLGIEIQTAGILEEGTLGIEIQTAGILEEGTLGIEIQTAGILEEGTLGTEIQTAGILEGGTSGTEIREITKHKAEITKFLPTMIGHVGSVIT